MHGATIKITNFKLKFQLPLYCAVFLLPSLRAQRLYRTASLHLPGHPLKTATIRITIKETHCTPDSRHVNLLVPLSLTDSDPC